MQRWREYLDQRPRQAHHPVLAPWLAFAALPREAVRGEGDRPLAERIAANSDPKSRINPLVAKAFAGKAPGVAGGGGEAVRRLFKEVEEEWQKALKEATEKKQPLRRNWPTPTARRCGRCCTAPVRRRTSPSPRSTATSTAPSATELTALRRRSISGAPPPRTRRRGRWLLAETPRPPDPRVLVRGNPANPGVAVPRQFLEMLSPDRKPFAKGSGRLELAQSIASKDNPLTARVMVNRVWMHHFGKGIVATPGDFGLRGEPPTHPELLDWLASEFVEGGWSVKQLHRLIVLSADVPPGQRRGRRRRRRSIRRTLCCGG